MIRRVVICGGAGFIGTALRRQLESSGYDVTVISRNPGEGQLGWDQLSETLEGAFAVVNLAGRAINCVFTDQNKREILTSRVESTEKIAAAINQCLVKPKKWINASATGIYGDRGDEALNESSPSGDGFLPEICTAWENACLLSTAETQKAVIRIGVVLSSKGGILAKLIPYVKALLGGSAGHGNQWVSWIHLTDLIRLIMHMIEHDTPSVVSGSTQNPVQNRDLMSWLRGLYRRPWSPPVPAFILKLNGRLIGPDASLALDSCRVISAQLPDFQFVFPSLESIKRSDI